MRVEKAGGRERAGTRQTAERRDGDSPYTFSENRVLDRIELEGAETDIPGFYNTNGGWVTAVSATSVEVISDRQLKADLEIMRASMQLPVYNPGTISDGSIAGAPQGRFFNYQMDHLVKPAAKLALPIEVTMKLARGEHVSAAELGVEVIGLIPAGKILGKSAKLLKGIGGEVLERFVVKFERQATHLTEKDVTGALKDIAGTPIVGDAGKVFQHQKEVEEALVGVGKKLNELNKAIDNGEFTGEVLDSAKKLRSTLQKQKDAVTDLLNAAKNSANKDR